MLAPPPGLMNGRHSGSRGSLRGVTSPDASYYGNRPEDEELRRVKEFEDQAKRVSPALYLFS